jgi:putative ABC transport system permease protein
LQRRCRRTLPNLKRSPNGDEHHSFSELECAPCGTGETKSADSPALLRGEVRERVALALFQNVKETTRFWRRRPLFICGVILTLVLGSSAVIALYAIVSASLLRDLPWTQSRRLVAINGVFDGRRSDPAYRVTWNRGAISWPLWNMLAASPAFDQVGAWFRTDRVNWTLADGREVLEVWNASTDFLRLLDIKPVLGRLFVPSEDQVVSTSALISHDLWLRKFGGDETVVGRSVALTQLGRPSRVFLIVGVLPKRLSFRGYEPDFILPIGLRSALAPYNNPTVYAIGRLSAGISLTQAQELTDRAATSFPIPEESFSVKLVDLRDDLVQGRAQSIWVLFGGAALLMLISLFNVSSLLLSEAVSRRREMFVRAALGASPRQILGGQLVESAVLAGIAIAASVWIAAVSIPWLSSVMPPELIRQSPPTIDWQVVLLVSGVVFCVVYLSTVGGALRDLSGRSPGALMSSTGQNRRISRLVVSTQVGVALILVMCGSLFAQTVINLMQEPLGFDPRKIVLIATATDARPGQAPSAQSRSPGRARGGVDINRLIAELSALPGIAAVSGVSRNGPFVGNDLSLPIETDSGVTLAASLIVVHKDLFRTLGIPLLSGRGFQENSLGAGSGSAIVSKTLEDSAFQGDAVGRMFRQRTPDGSPGRQLEVVGVVGDVKQRDLGAGALPVVYIPDSRASINHLIVRVSGDPSRFIPTLLNAIAERAPGVTVTGVTTMTETLRASIEAQRLRAGLSVGYAGVGLALAVIGIFGATHREVQRRTREIAIRKALGANPSQVRRALFPEAVTTLGIGLVGGAIVFFWINGAIRSMLFGASATSAATMVAVSAMMLGAATAGVVVAIRPASRIEPTVLLKE